MKSQNVGEFKFIFSLFFLEECLQVLPFPGKKDTKLSMKFSKSDTKRR